MENVQSSSTKCELVMNYKHLQIKKHSLILAYHYKIQI